MAENYKRFFEYAAQSSNPNELQIGWNRDETVIDLERGSIIDDTGLYSLHLADDSTDYQNNTGRTVYAIVTMNAFIDTGDRRFKIWSAPTTDSKAAATEVFDSDDIQVSSWNSTTQKMTSRLVPITNNHYIVVENVSGSASRRLSFHDGIVIEPSA